MQLCSIEQVMQPLDDPDTRMIRLRSTNHQLNLLVTSKFIKDRHNSIGVSWPNMRRMIKSKEAILKSMAIIL
jgi:hypothetical protein